MSNTKNVYGTPGDTSFRKKYDRELYAQKALERESSSKPKPHDPLHKPKHRHVTPPPDPSTTTSRAERLDLTSHLNKTTLVPAGASVGKRGKGAGFYCDACDLTFKDSLQWVDHLNSKQHLYATGESGEVKRATLEVVRQRLQWLKEKKKREKEEAERGGLDLQSRLEERKKLEEEEKRIKKEKRKEKKKVKTASGQAGGVKTEEGAGVADGGTEGDEMEVDQDAVMMARMMGFAGGFGSTKKA